MKYDEPMLLSLATFLWVAVSIFGAAFVPAAPSTDLSDVAWPSWLCFASDSAVCTAFDSPRNSKLT